MTITIIKRNRVWTVVRYTGKNGDRETRCKTDSLPADAANGSTITVNGKIVWTDNGYHSQSELVIVSEEDSRRAIISKWMGYFRDSLKQGYIYERAVAELHAAGIHECDDEISDARRQIDAAKRSESINRWIGYFRDHASNDGYIYERAVTELHALGCHDYDSEISETRNKLAEDKETRRAARAEEERVAGIITLALPAYHGFGGRPAKDSILTHKGRVYRVISSYYHDSDGMSFGAMNDEWYSVKAQDITDTEEGQQRIASDKAAAEREAACRNEQTAASALIRNIRSSGTVVVSGSESSSNDSVRLSVDSIPGDTVIDTFDIFGSGEIVRVDESAGLVYLIVNNGMDGDDWSVNNISTGGAGAYGYVAPLAAVSSFLIAYKDASAAKAALDK